MSLFGFVGSVISGVGSFISSVGQAAGNEALANLGSSIGSFGETVSNFGQQTSGGEASGESSQSSDQMAGGSAPAETVKTVKPITPPDIAETQPYNLIDEIGLEAYKALNATPIKMPAYSEYRYDERFQEAQLMLKTMGIGQYTTWEQWAARFAWWQWQEDDPALLKAVKEWWVDRGQVDYIARDAALMARFEATDGRAVRRVRFPKTLDDWGEQSNKVRNDSRVHFRPPTQVGVGLGAGGFFSPPFTPPQQSELTCQEQCERYANTTRSSGIGYSLCVEQCSSSSSSSNRCSIIMGEAQRLKDAGLPGRQILSDILRFAQNQFNYTSSKELSDDISCAIVGARDRRTIIAATPLNLGGIFGPKNPDFIDELGAGGWHSDYEDNSENQAFHFWAYVNTVAHSGRPWLAMAGDQFHECFDIREDQNGQRTTEDSRLAIAGIILGERIYDGVYTPIEVDDWVDNWLGVQSFDNLLATLSPEDATMWRNVLRQRACPFIDR